MAKKQNTFIYYGTKTNIAEIKTFIEFQLDTHKETVDNKKRTPICIWGNHGIGKTQLVEQIAKEKGYQFHYIAPAQFEEMGDLLGLPTQKEGKTIFLPPDWAPREKGPGIFLIDDINRADDRILRGIMQLLQNYELSSWQFPPNWHIICTANPDGGDYSVTPMDDAMLTRMLHITMQFDPKNWAHWAEQNKVDERGINFVLLHPETVTGERTTPRTLEQFFQTIQLITNLKKNIKLVRQLAEASLDKETVEHFIAFIRQGFEKLITPDEILNKDFKKVVLPAIEKVVKQDVMRLDILSVLFTRVFNYIKQKKTLKTKETENFAQLILIEWIPIDIRLTLMQDAVQCNSALAKITAKPEIAMLMLDSM